MAFKIYVKENYFYIQDTSLGGLLYEGLAKDVLVRRATEASTDFAFKGINQWAENRLLAFADIQDEAGSPYADLATFISFYESSSGKSSPQASGNTFTGWGAYTDTVLTEISPLSVTGNNTYVNLPNNKGNTLEIQKPMDVSTFYDGTAITGRNGDGISLTLSFAVKPLTNQPTRVTLVPDIGGAIGEIEDYARDVVLGRGQNITQRYLSSFDAYTLDTWEANGAILKIKSDHNCEVFGIRYLITRTHKAR